MMSVQFNNAYRSIIDPQRLSLLHNFGLVLITLILLAGSVLLF